MKRSNLPQAFLALFLIANPALVPAQAERLNPDNGVSVDSASGATNKTNSSGDIFDNLRILDNGNASKVSLAEVLVGEVLTVTKDELTVGKNRGLLIKVRNTSDRPVVFDGASAIAVVDGRQLKPSSLRQIQNAADPSTGIAKLAMRGTEAAFSIGGIATVQDALRNRGPILNRYGGDERRRADEHASFMKRALWPNDTSEGYLFFLTNQTLIGAEISLPVHTLYNDSDSVVLKGVGAK